MSCPDGVFLPVFRLSPCILRPFSAVRILGRTNRKHPLWIFIADEQHKHGPDEFPRSTEREARTVQVSPD
jgi:hypothetical protein